MKNSSGIDPSKTILKPIEHQLSVLFHGKPVGLLLQLQGGDLAFQYHAEYLKNKPLPLSISLPLQKERLEGTAVKAFFSGLLPDDVLLKGLAKYLGKSHHNAFALLDAVGGECAGAITILPTNQTVEAPTFSENKLLTQIEVGDLLKDLEQRPLLVGENGVRLSLAGAQRKLAVIYKENQLYLSYGNAPTTHILKPMIENHPLTQSCYNELFCMRLAKALGFETPDTFLYWVDDQTPCYLVERYDRLLNKNGTIDRLHQEDFCQALGIVPALKYDVTYQQCKALLHKVSFQPAKDNLLLLQRVIFNYLIGNCDAHGKNFSLLYDKTKPRLAPVYDVLCTVIDPALSKHMAMKIGGEADPEKLYLWHWHSLVEETKTAQRALEKQLLVLAEQVPQKALVLKKSLAEKEGIASSVFDDILAVITKRATLLLQLIQQR